MFYTVRRSKLVDPKKFIKSKKILELSEDLGKALGRDTGKGSTVEDPNLSSTVETLLGL